MSSHPPANIYGGNPRSATQPYPDLDLGPAQAPQYYVAGQYNDPYKQPYANQYAQSPPYGGQSEPPNPYAYEANMRDPYSQQYGQYYNPSPPPPPPPPPIVDESGIGAHMGNEELGPDLPPSVRNGFIRKVYGILSVQLIFTFGIALTFNLVEPMGDWLRNDGWWMIIIGAVLALGSICALACVPDLARKVPVNYIMLSLLTVGMAITVSYAGAAVDTQAFAIAMGITAVVVVGLSLFACQTKIDFTGCGPYLFVMLLVLLVFGIVSAIVRSNIVHIVYSALGAMVFSFYLVYDTQVIVGGKHRKYQFSIDDYIFAAIALYIDIINLFTYILALTSAAQN